MNQVVRSCVLSLVLLLCGARHLKGQSSSTISTFAGTGIAGNGGDNGPATAAQLSGSQGVKVDPSGNVYVADTVNNRVRKITPNGIITTIAGTGTAGSSADNGPAVNAQLNQPRGIALDSSGNLYIADSGNNRVRKVDTNGVIATVAGTGVAGSGGDGGRGTSAQLNNPLGLALDSAGNLYIADAYNSKVRRVDPFGTIITYAGTGTPGSAGDAGPATAAMFLQPYGLAVDGANNLYISDVAANQIRRITPAGIITTFAGSGQPNFGGDGGSAALAQLNGPAGMAFDSVGNLYFADQNNNRVRIIDTSGIITTVAGDGTAAYSNDGLVPLSAGIGSPTDVTISSNGLLFIAQRGFNVVRLVNETPQPEGIDIIGGDQQTATAGTAFAQALGVRVFDKNHHDIKGITVTFTAPGSGASATLTPHSVITDDNGRALANATANLITGSYQVMATVEGVSPAIFHLSNTAASPTDITFVTQPADSPAGSTISPVTVRVTASGNPVVNTQVTITSQPGSVSGTTTAQTDSNGQATFSNLIITTAGHYQLKAAAGSITQLSSFFNITGGVSRIITVLSGNSQTAAVGTAYGSPLKVTVKDTYSNPVSGAAVTFTPPSSGPSVTFAGSTTVNTDSNGVATSPGLMANSQTGAVRVMASTSGASQAATFDLNNTPGPANKLDFVQQPTNTIAGHTITPAVTVQLKDSSGNPVGIANVPITIQGNPLTQALKAFAGGTTQNTNSAGLATFSNLSISQVGNYQLIASATSYASAQSNTFTISAGPAHTIVTAGGTPQSATISTAFVDQLAVIVRDEFMNPVSGVTVTYTVPASGASATLSAAQVTTDATGHASVKATANATAGSYTVTAAVSGVTPSASFSLTNVAAGAATLVFTQQPVNTTAGATISAVIVKLTDSGNNPVNGVGVTLSATGGSGTLQGTVTGTTDTTGTVTFNNLRITVTGTYQLRAVAGALSALSTQFQITPAAAANIAVFDGNGQTAQVGTAYSSPLRARVTDSFNNPIANAQVTFSAPASGSSVTFSGSTVATAATDGLGIATSLAATANQNAGLFQVTASTAGATQPATFNLTNVAGTANKLGFIQQPTNTTAGQPIAPAVTVQLQDNFGNKVAMAGVNVSIQASPVAGLSRSLQGTATQPTDATGLATFSALTLNQSGTYTLTAQASGVTSATSSQFVVTAGTAANIQATGGSLQSAIVNAAFRDPLQVLVTDAQNNPVSGATVMYTAPGSGASAVLSNQSTVTDASGHASVNAVANGVAGSYTVTAGAAGASGTASFALTNLAAGAANLTFVQQPSGTTAGATMGPVSALVADSGNNPISGVVVTLAAQGGSGTLQGNVTGTTDVTGTATFNNLKINIAGTYQLKAASGMLSVLSNSFQITSAAASNITVSNGDGQSAPVTTAYGMALAASVQDSFGNPVPNVEVTFTAPSTGPSVTFAESTTVTTNGVGIAVAPTAMANQVTGTFQVTATTAGAPQPATFNLTNIAGTANKLAFVQQPVDTVAGQTITPPVTVQLKDSFGNNVAMAGVSVSIQTGSISTQFRAATISANTDASGLATLSNLSIAQAGTFTLTASAAGITSATSDPFHITAGAAASIQATGGTPQTTTVLTAFPAALEVTVLDGQSNPVSGVAVNFAAPGSGASATLSAASATTDANGHASITATANGTAGSYNVTATTGGLSPAHFALTNTAGSAAAIAFVQQPQNTQAGATMAAVSVRLTDSGGNPVSGVDLTVSIPGFPGRLSGTTTVSTNSSGLAVYSDLKITVTGTYKLQAAEGTISGLSASFDITPATSGQTITVLDGNGQSAQVNTAFGGPLRVLVQDSFHNPASGSTVTFTPPSTGPSVAFGGPASVTTDSQGTATSPTLTANSVSGSFTVSAASAGAATAASFSLTNLAGNASKLAFVQQPNNAVAGQAIAPPITVQLQDSLGNPVNQAGVLITLQSGGVTRVARSLGGSTSQPTNGSGLAAFSGISDSQAGTYTLLAQASGVASATSNPFTITAASAATIQATGGTPQSTAIITAFTNPLQATVADTFGNPVSGISVTFTVPGSGATASLSVPSAVTDSAGHAITNATANSIAGSYVVTAAAAGVSGVATFALTNVAAGVAHLTFVQQPTSTTAGTTINTVTVKLTDSGNNPVSGVVVGMSATIGSGTLEGTLIQTTDASGTATFNDLVIRTTGGYKLRAATGLLSELSQPFAITAAAPANITVFGGDGQSATVGTQYGTVLRARVTDQFGNSVKNAQVTFTAPGSGASVTFDGSTAVLSGEQGIATAPAATANQTAGLFQVTATTPGAPQPATFNLTNLVGIANKLKFMQQPSDTTAGQAITPAVTVQLQDSFGNPVAKSGVSVKMQANPVATVSRTLRGTLSAITDQTGLATFPNITIDQASAYTLTATAAEVASDTSKQFNVTAGGASSIQAVGGTPQTATILTPFSMALQVAVMDTLGNPVSGVSVSFSAPGSGTSATLSAPSATTDANGNASVNATANSAAGDYVVTATATGAGSATFHLTNTVGSPSAITFVQQPQNTQAGSTMAQVSPRLTDSGGNPIAGTQVTVSIPVFPGRLTGTTTATTDASGQATYDDLKITVAGTYTLQASTASVSGMSASFTITPATSGQTISVAGGSGQSTQVNTAYGGRLRALVQDSFNNPVVGVAVTFTPPATGPSGTFGALATVNTDDQGIATSPVLTANSTAGAFAVVAATAGAATPASFNLTNLPGNASKLAFKQQPSDALAGQTIVPPITVQLQDSEGNSVRQANVLVTLQSSGVTRLARSLSGTASQPTDATGLATFAGISESQAGVYNLLAQADGFASATSDPFTIRAGEASAIRATGGTPQSTTINTPFANALQATVTDSLGNPVSGVTVNFAAPGSGASATLSAASAVTDAAGHANVTANANNVAGGYHVTAVATGITGTASFALTNLASGAATLTFVQQPARTTAGATISAVMVKLTDSGNNPVSGINVTMSAQGGSGTLGGTLTVVTDITGTATFNDLVIQAAGTYLLRAAAGPVAALSNPFQITAATAVNITVFGGNGQSAAVGTPYTTPLRASVQDAFGNPVSGAAVSFTPPASGASITFAGPPNATTDALGIATAPAATANQTPGMFQVTAATQGAPQPATFNLTNVAGTANTLTFVQQPTDTTAGQPVTPPVAVQIQDSFGNNVAVGGVSVSIQANPATSRLRALRGASTVNTDSIGLATFPNISLSTAGAYTLTAEAAGFSSATSITFNVITGAPASIQATGGTPQSATLLTAFPQSLQATVKDASGNPVSGVTVTFTAPASGASAALSAGQATTDASGLATVTATANAIAGSYAVQAAIAGGSSTTFNLSNVGGGAGALNFVQQPPTTAAGATFTTSVKLTDGSGNPVPGITVTVTISDNSATLIGITTGQTDSTGVARFNNLSINTTGTYQLQATAGSLSMLSSSFQIAPAGHRTIGTLDGAGQSAVVNTAYGLPLRALVRDQFGNPVPGVSVTFSLPPSGAGGAFAGSPTVTTDASGIATSLALTANSQTGTFQVTAATDGAPSPAVFSLTNLAGAANRLSFAQQPTPTIAGKTIAPPVTVQVKDSAGNPVSQAGIQVTLTFVTAGAVSVPPVTATTDPNGFATFSALTIAQAGTYIAQAQATGLASAQSNSFGISANIPSSIRATGGTPQSTQVLTVFSEVLQATLTDSAGNPVAGVPVTFLAPLAGAGGTFGGATSVSVVTDQQGRATAPFTANSSAGVYLVTATSAVVTGQAQFTLANVSNTLPSLTFAQQPTDSGAGQTIAPPVTVRIVASSGTPVPTPGVPVLLSLASGTGTLSGTLVQTTDNNGTATFNDLSIELAGVKQLRAISAQDVPAVSNSFQITPGPAATITVTSGSPQATTPSQLFPSLLQAQVRDAKGNPIAGATVTFSVPSTGSSGTFARSPAVTTDAKGIATAPALTANSTTGTFNATATVQSVAAPALFKLTVLPNPTGSLQVLPGQINFASESGQPAPASQTVEVTNADGRAESWTAVSSAPWLSVSPPSGTTRAAVTVQVDPTGLAPGAYSGTITFTTPTGQFTLFVVYRITDKPALVASPASLLFFGFQQGAPPAQTVSVTSTGRTISYNVTLTVTSPSGGTWLQVGSTQGQTPNSLQVSVNVAGLAEGVYQGAIVLTPTEAGLNKITMPVTLVLGPAIQTPVILTVTNAGSFHPSGAPGALMTIFGRALSDAVYQASTLPLPQTLGPTTVTVNGASVPLYYVSPTQINFQMPSGQSAGTSHVVVNNAALKASSPEFPVTLTAVDPGLFVIPDGRAAALNQDLSVHTAATPQPAGAIILVYLTGQGPTTPPVQDGVGAPSSPLSLVNGQVSADIGGKPAEVVFAGLAPGFVGDTQVNVRIPEGLTPGDQPVFITINGVPSNAGLITVR